MTRRCSICNLRFSFDIQYLLITKKGQRDDRHHHLASVQAGTLHPLREGGGQEHVSGRPNPQPVGEARNAI